MHPDFQKWLQVFLFDPSFGAIGVSQMVLVVKTLPTNAGDVRDTGSIPGSGRSPGGGHGKPLLCSWASLVAQTVKNLPAMQETWVKALDWEDPLEKGTATHCSILAWRIPWTEKPGRLQSMRSHRVRHDWSDLAAAAVAATLFSRDGNQGSSN